MKLVSQNADLVLSDLGDQVDQPNNKVTEAGQQTNQAYDQSDDVLGLGVADDAINTADDVAQEQLQQDLSDLGQIFVLFSIHVSFLKINCHSLGLQAAGKNCFFSWKGLTFCGNCDRINKTARGKQHELFG